jgi:hypothetical protein
VTRVQQGLRASGLPAGVHSSFLECRIGHFERMVSRALGAEVGSVARAGTITYETRNDLSVPAAGNGAAHAATNVAPVSARLA